MIDPPLKTRLTRWMRNRFGNTGLTDGLAIHGRFTVSVHDVADLRDATDRDFAPLPKSEKLDIAREVAPQWSETTHNVTTTYLHEYMVDNLDPGQAVNMDIGYLALGTATTVPTAADTTLGTEVYRVAVTDIQDQGNDLFTSTFLDTTEANGNVLEEAGLSDSVTANDPVVDRSLISTIDKTTNNTATIDATLQFRSA